MRPLLWAEYALGDDYHDEVRKRLSEVAEKISSATGAECRVCVDTAPLRERYWAVKADSGFIGLNNQLILPRPGRASFSARFLPLCHWSLTSLRLREAREGCGRCLKSLSGKALSARADGGR